MFEICVLPFAVFQPTGNFSLTGMTAAAEETLDITFRLSSDAKCPGSSNAAVQPRLSVLRLNCDGSVRRGVAPKALWETLAQCSGDAVFKAAVNAPFIRGDACSGVHIQLVDGVSKMAIVQYA
jgi:hypothetical protein